MNENESSTIGEVVETKHSNHHEVHHHKKSFTLTTPIAIIIASVVIAFGLLGYGFITTTGGSNSAPSKLFTGKAIDSSDFLDGNEKSKVILVEYSDPECPFCAAVHPTIKQLRTEYAKKIAYTYRYFPLTQIHPHAFDESRAIFCAGNTGGSKKFFEYIDALFGYKVNNKTTQLPATGKEDIARSVGLDIPSFTACMGKQDAATAVNASMNDGVAAGVQGTPASFILVKTRKGYEVVSMVDGARPYEYFKTVIDEALAR
jgi:protein-disulfide isomerase